MSVELWKAIFDWVAVVLVGFTFIAGAGALITGRILNDRQSAQLQRMDTVLTNAQIDLAKAQKDAFNAQLALEQYVNVLGKNVNSRLIDSKQFIDLLKGQPKGSVEIWYEPGPEEVHFFAVQLSDVLGARGVGWEVGIKPFPTKNDGGPTGSPHVFDALRRTADLDGMAIAAKDISLSNTQLSALRDAIRLSTGGWGISGLEQFFGEPTLPDNHFVVAIGPHQPNVPLVEFAHPRK